MNLSVMQRVQMGWVRGNQKPCLYVALFIWKLVHRHGKEDIKHCKYILHMNLAIFYSRLKDLKFELFYSNKNEEKFHINPGILKKAMNNKFG